MAQNDEAQYIERILNGETELFFVFLNRYSRPLHLLIAPIVTGTWLLVAAQKTYGMS